MAVQARLRIAAGPGPSPTLPEFGFERGLLPSLRPCPPVLSAALHLPGASQALGPRRGPSAAALRRRRRRPSHPPQVRAALLLLVACLIAGAQARHTKAKIRRDDRSLILVAQVRGWLMARQEPWPRCIAVAGAAAAGASQPRCPARRTAAALWLWRRWAHEPDGVQLPAVEDRQRAQDLQDLGLPQVRSEWVAAPQHHRQAERWDCDAAACHVSGPAASPPPRLQWFQLQRGL